MSRSKQPKDYIVNIEDFQSSLPAIDHVTTSVRFKNADYLLFLNLNDLHNGVVFICTDAFSVYWMKQYEYHDFEAIRHKLGMEGTYSGYFDILRDSIYNRNSLSLEISNEVATLNLKYQISKGVTLTGGFDLGVATSLQKDPGVFMKINRSFVLDLAKMVEVLNKRNDDLTKEMNDRMTAVDVASKAKKPQEMGMGGLGTGAAGFGGKKENLKQKAKTDLINPNRKKVNARGMKFNAEIVNLTNINEDNE